MLCFWWFDFRKIDLFTWLSIFSKLKIVLTCYCYKGLWEELSRTRQKTRNNSNGKRLQYSCTVNTSSNYIYRPPDFWTKDFCVESKEEFVIYRPRFFALVACRAAPPKTAVLSTERMSPTWLRSQRDSDVVVWNIALLSKRHNENSFEIFASHVMRAPLNDVTTSAPKNYIKEIFRSLFKAE